MKTISVSNLRIGLTQVLDQVKKGESILVTLKGKPVAQIIPPIDQRKEAIAKLKALRKTTTIDDIVSPIGDPWNAQ